MSARWQLHARNSFAVAAAGLLLVGLAAPGGAQATTLPTPTLISSQVSNPNLSAPCTPGPHCDSTGVLVVQGGAFNLTVTLTATDSNGNTVPAAFTKNTTLTLTATGPGTLTPTSVTMPANTSQDTFTTLSYSRFANNVTVTASSGGKGKNAIPTTPSNPFNVLQTLQQFAKPGNNYQQGIGVDDCATVTAANPICGVIVLPNGANTPILLDTGSCTNLNCNALGTVVQFVGDIGGLYQKDNPAKLIILCYRTVCGQGGVHHILGVAASSGTSGALVTAPPCPAKNTVGPDQTFCTDVVENNRLNADDSLVYILFTDDFRGSL